MEPEREALVLKDETQIFAPKAPARSILSRVKIMATMDIVAEKREAPGHAHPRSAWRSRQELDLRVGASPPRTASHRSSLGSSTSRRASWALEELGFHPDDYKRSSRRSSRSRSRIFLVTGPTGSGKDDDALRRAQGAEPPRREDHHGGEPVNYNLAGINQCEVQGGHRAHVPSGSCATACCVRRRTSSSSGDHDRGQRKSRPRRRSRGTSCSQHAPHERRPRARSRA